MAAGLRFRRVVMLNNILRLKYNFSTVVSSYGASQVTLNEDVVKYPPIRPKYPPGTWGSMNHTYAWRWHELKEKLMNITNVQDRHNKLLTKETLAMLPTFRTEHRIHNFEERVNNLIDEAATVLYLDSVSNHPMTLEFRKYVTKTHMIEWGQAKAKFLDSDNISLVDNVVKHLKNHISEYIHMEYDIIERVGLSRAERKTQFCKLLIRCISETLILELGKHLNHLNTCHYDEDVIVRALWSRHGFERKKNTFTYDPDVESYETCADQAIISECAFDSMLRSHIPLPEFESTLDGETDYESPKMLFKTSVYGQDKPCRRLLKSVLAGHKLGDPCEYGLVGFLSTCSTHEIDKSYGPKVARDCRLAMGLTHIFTWLTAQAYNQGFSHIIDLTYPLTSLAVMTDGEKFSFLAYQLNTLELWKDDEGNKKVNLCWYTDEIPLYRSIEHGQVKEFNDEALTLLVKMFMLAPAQRTYDMKPTLSDKADLLHLKLDFVPRKVTKEEVITEEQFIVG